MRQAVRRNVRLARLLEQRLGERGFEILPGGELSIACARWVPNGLSPAELDALQDRIRDAVVETGRAWFANTRHDGKTWLCFRITNLHTASRHVDELVDLVATAGRAQLGRHVGERRIESPRTERSG